MKLPNPDSSPPQLRRGLRPSGLIAVTYLCVAGGAFGLEDAVGAVGPLVVLLGILILPWLWSFPTALMTAELSTAMPEDGGYVIWVERAFGRFWGFQEGWLSWLYSFADNALYPAMFLDYLAYLCGDLTPTERVFIGIAVIVVTTWLNIRGIQLVGFLSILFTLFILAPFAMMVLLGTSKVNPSHWLATHGNVNWSLLLSVLLWNTCGWDNAGCCAGEVANPEKTYPLTMITAVLLVTFSYLLPMAVGVGVVTNWSKWKVGMFPKIAAQVGGGWLGVWLTVAGLVSAVGMLNALLCTSSRVPFAMARHRLLPRNLGVLHPSYATPWRAILVNSLGVAALVQFSFQELIEFDMFFYAAALILEFAALIKLRVCEPEMTRPYRVPFGVPGVLAISLPPFVLCALSIALANKTTKLAGIIAVGVGLAVYHWQTRSGRASETEASPLRE